MTLSLLISSLMVSSLAALVVTLVVDAVRGRRRREPALSRTAEPVLRPGHGRLVQRRDCPQALRPATAAAARARRGRTPRSCRR
jgi:hypothetical protein